MPFIPSAAQINAGGFTSYALAQHQEASTVDGGTATAGSWVTRTINTEVSDTDGIMSLSANQISLVAGTYKCWIRAALNGVNQCSNRLRNVTDGVTLLNGSSENAVVGGATISGFIMGRFTIAAGKLIEIQSNVRTTKATDGFGVQAGGWVTGGVAVEIYIDCEFWKVA